MEKVTYALVGFGGIAERRIAKEGFGLEGRRVGVNPLAVLKGVHDADARRRGPAEDLGLHWYASYAEILADAEVQAVYVATNNLTHAPLAKAALKARKHVFVEKPFATRLSDALELQSLARRAGLSVGVDHMMIHNAFHQKAKEMLDRGLIGEADDIVLSMEFLYGAKPEEARTWRCSNPEELGGPVGDVGSHCLYMAEYLMGSPVETVRCVYAPKSLKIRVEDGALIDVTFKNRKTGAIRVAFNRSLGGGLGGMSASGVAVYGPRGVIRTYGTMGQLSGHRDEPMPMRVELDLFHSRRDMRVGRRGNIYQAAIGEHARSIIGRKPMDGSAGTRNLRLILACHESARGGGRQVRVP